MNNTTLSPALPPDPMELSCCSGYGQHHTNEADENKPDKLLKPYSTITWSDIKQMVDNPQSCDKQEAQWLIPSILLSRNFRDQEQKGQFWFLWLDLDENTLPLHELHKILVTVLGGNFQFESYTTSSAIKSNQKSRILIPLDKPLTGEEWILCQEILNDRLEANSIIPDRATERCAQLCYLPNRGDYYYSVSDRTSPLFNPTQAFEQKLELKRQALVDAEQTALKRRKQAEKHLASLIYSGNTSQDLIGAFNSTYMVEDILNQADYDQHGDRFRHPNSSSGSFSASVKNDRVHSLSSSDPLYTGGGNQGAHDSFSAFQTLFHDADMNAALKDAGNNWLTINGESWNKYQHREYMKCKQEPIKKDEAKQESDDEQDDFLLQLELFNDRHGMLLVEGKAVVCYREYDENIDCRKIQFAPSRALTEYYSTTLVLKDLGSKGRAPVPIFSEWLQYLNRRQYKGIVFKPIKGLVANSDILPAPIGNNSALNIYAGLSFEPKKGTCSLIKNHILEVWCNNNIEHYDYIIKWMARMFQYPHLQGETVIVLKSGQGAGKNSIIDIFAEAFGQHSFIATDTQDLAFSNTK